MALEVSRASVQDIIELLSLTRQPAWRAALQADWGDAWQAPADYDLRRLINQAGDANVAIVRDSAQGGKLVLAAPVHERGDGYEFGIRLWDASLTALAHVRALRALMRGVCAVVAARVGPETPMYGYVRAGTNADAMFSGMAFLTRTTDGVRAYFTGRAGEMAAGL